MVAVGKYVFVQLTLNSLRLSLSQVDSDVTDPHSNSSDATLSSASLFYGGLRNYFTLLYCILCYSCILCSILFYSTPLYTTLTLDNFTVLYCTVLYCTELYRTVPYCTALAMIYRLSAPLTQCAVVGLNTCSGVLLLLRCVVSMASYSRKRRV